MILREAAPGYSLTSPDLKLELGFGFQVSGFGCRTLRARAQVLKGLVLVIAMVIKVSPLV